MNATPDSPQPQTPQAQAIVITDINIPFWRLVGVLVKWSLAAIPASIILILVSWLFFSVLTAVGVIWLGGM